MKGHVRQRSNGKWEYSIPQGKGPDGKRKRVTAGAFITRKEAEQALIKRLYEMNEGLYIEPSKETVQSYFTKWIEQKKGQVKFTTYSAMEGYMKKHVTPVIGHVQLSKLTAQHIQQVYTEMNKAYAPQTVKHVHNMLKQGLQQAVRLKIISENPSIYCMLPRIERKELNIWSVEELQEFLDFAKSSRWYLAFLIATYTGARKGEILALRWENIDFRKSTITIRNSLSKTKGGGFELTKPKTNSSIRCISVPSQVIEELERWKNIIQVDEVNKLQDTRLFNKPQDFVVHTYDGNYVNPYNFSKTWNKLVEKSGLKRIRFHDLRHTHATLLIQSGVNMKAVSARLGHSTVTMTLDTYSHLTPQMEDGIMNMLEHLLN